ncbi:dnaJ homolog subfamily C member 10-like [Ornithodoros turicata]|uniref:dnaJ homolog subfamily C member 10-like n=1 Tax=Ornithodoros turicata TaxID=34597 RepID=UPI0031392EBB
MKLNHTSAVVISLLVSAVLCDDYYKLLGIERDADTREIRRAFKKLALRLHPDKNQGDSDAHDTFVKLNKAYEVLKDPDTRKRYDTYGEEGLGDNNRWNGKFHSWNYYYEKFGIYDDDPEIVTLSRNDFQSAVLESSDIWFINFYSPQCSHCHHLAPNWRKLAQSFEGIIRVGAVNCEEDWQMCRQEGIYSFPSLLIYPLKQKYVGTRELDDLQKFVLGHLPDFTLHVEDTELLGSPETNRAKPTVLFVCPGAEHCVSSDEVKKLAVALDGLAQVSSVNCEENPGVCRTLAVEDGTYFFGTSDTKKKIEGSDAAELRRAVLKELPDLEIITRDVFSNIMKSLSSEGEEAEPWFLYFNRAKLDTLQENELKHIKGYVQSVHLGYVDCDDQEEICSQLSVSKVPSYLVLRSGGSYEVYHGRVSARDLASFLKESMGSRLETLTSSTFKTVLESPSPWLVDFFAPWCPPCMRALPELRKTSRWLHNVRFATVDCAAHASVCQAQQISSYPSMVLFNNSARNVLTGFKTASEIREFVEVSLDPKVVKLTPEAFSKLVEEKGEEEVWAIDFYAPWCGPCMRLEPEWNRLGKLVADEPNIRVGKVDCESDAWLCSKHGVRSYPNLRVYGRGHFDSRRYFTFNGWSRDSASLRAWVLQFLPSSVEELDHDAYFRTVLVDRTPWVVDFYAPWCGHCVQFRPHFEAVAKKLEGRVKFGALNCEEHHQVCDAVEIRRYPTIVFYPGTTSKSQHPLGELVHGQGEAEVLSSVNELLRQYSKSRRIEDEL